MKDIDNRDSNETWVELSNGQILEMDNDEAMRLLSSFYVNRPPDDEDLKKDLEQLYIWSIQIAVDCGFDIDGGKIKKME